MEEAFVSSWKKIEGDRISQRCSASATPEAIESTSVLNRVLHSVVSMGSRQGWDVKFRHTANHLKEIISEG